MPVEEVLIKINSDVSGIKSTIDGLQQVGKVDKDNAAQFQRTNQQHQAALKQTGEQAGSLQSTFKKLGETMVATFGVYQMINFAQTALNSYNEVLKQENKLSAALGDRKSMTQDLIDLAVEMQEKTTISKESILSVESFLAVQGRTEAQIKKMTKAAGDLSVVLDVDVFSAAKMLDMTFEGTIGRLGRYDERLKNLTKSQLENGEAVDLLAQKYGGLAEESATSFDKLSIKWKEVKESIGESLYVLLFKKDKDYEKEFIKAGEDAAADFTKNFKEAFKGKDIQISAIGDLPQLKSNLVEAEKELAAFKFSAKESGMSLVDAFGEANPMFVKLSEAVGFAKSNLEQLQKLIHPDETKKAEIDFTKMSKEQLEELIKLKQADAEEGDKDAKRIIQGAKYRLEVLKKIYEYQKNVAEGLNKIRQLQVDLMKDKEGTEKLLAQEQVRHDKEIESNKEFYKNTAQLKEADKLTEQLHQMKILKIHQEANDKALEIDQNYYIASLSQNDKAVAEIMQKYEKQIEERDKVGLPSTDLLKKETDEMNALVIKQGEELLTTQQANDMAIYLEKQASARKSFEATQHNAKDEATFTENQQVDLLEKEKSQLKKQDDALLQIDTDYASKHADLQKQIATKDKEIEEAKVKAAQDAAKAKIEIEQKYEKMVSDGLDAMFEQLQQNSDNEKKLLDDKTNIQEHNIEQQQALAARGLKNDLSFEETKQNELEKKKLQQDIKDQKRQKAQMAAKTALAFIDTYQKDMDSGNYTSGSALMDAFRSTMLAQIMGRAIASVFEEGGIVGIDGNPVSNNGILSGARHSQGGILINAEGGEGILSRKEIANMGIFNFYNLKRLLKNPIGDNNEISGAGELINEVRQLNETFSKIPKITYNIDGLSQLIKTEIKNGLKTQTTFKKRTINS